MAYVVDRFRISSCSEVGLTFLADCTIGRGEHLHSTALNRRHMGTCNPLPHLARFPDLYVKAISICPLHPTSALLYLVGYIRPFVHTIPISIQIRK